MKIGLALSGGGALGAAHAGVLEELYSAGIRVDAVCGTSAGAIIGLLYCEGGVEAIQTFLDDYVSLHITSKVRGLLIKPPGRLFTDIGHLVSKHVKSKDIRDIRPKFMCVATDISDGECIVLDQGDPVEAVLASAAYPGVFPVQKVGPRYLIDGGVTCNMPSEITRSTGIDFLIGSSLYTVPPIPKENTPPLGRVQVMVRSLEIMERALSSLHMTQCDFCFVPPTESFRWYDFDRIQPIAEVGRIYAREKIGELVSKLQNTGYYVDVDAPAPTATA